MRSIRKLTLNALTALSLLLCVAVMALWARSYASENHLLEFQQGRCLLIGIDASPQFVRSVRESSVLETFIHNLRTPPAQDFSDHPLAPPQEHHRFGLEWVRGTGLLFASNDSYGLAPFWMVSVPLWLVALVAAVAPGALLVRRWIAGRRRRTNLCVKCSYDLTGNVSGVCSECGTAIAKAG